MRSPGERAPLVEVADVGFDYGGGFRLAGVSFTAEASELLGVVGPNSSGKTTLLRLLTRVHEPARGEIRLAGTPLPRIPRRALAREVAVVPQELVLTFPFTVAELVLMGRYPRSPGRLFEGPDDLARARDALRLVGVEELGPRGVDTLAGGERQRALLARALCQEPRVLLLDEPTSQLDLGHQREIAALLRRLHRERGMAIVLVTHDLNLAGALADRLVLLVGGRIVRQGTPAEVLEEAVLEEAYGCPVRVEKDPASGRPVVQIRWVDEAAPDPGRPGAAWSPASRRR